MICSCQDTSYEHFLVIIFFLIQGLATRVVPLHLVLDYAGVSGDSSGVSTEGMQTPQREGMQVSQQTPHVAKDNYFSKMDVEVETKLEVLELNMTSSLERKISNLVEVIDMHTLILSVIV